MTGYEPKRESGNGIKYNIKITNVDWFGFFCYCWVNMARVLPRRGGEHPIYRIFLGGGELNNQYQLIGTRHYKFTGQRRSAKVINSIEQALLSSIQSTDQA